MIILVVLGAYLWEYRGYPALRGFMFAIYMFHMPAFIFISGYFSRSENSTSDRSLGNILIAFILLNFSMMFYAVLVETKSFSFIQLYYSSWYLLALFLYRLTLPWCRRIPFIVPVSVGVSLWIGFWQAINDVWQLQKIIALYPFFTVGPTLTTEQMESVVAKLKRHLIMCWSALFLISILFVWLIFSKTIGLNDFLWLSPGLKMEALKRGLVIMLAGAMILILLGITPRDRIALVGKWGKNSLAIYVLHRIFSLLLAKFFPQLPDDIAGGLTLVIACFLTLLVFGTDKVSRLVDSVLDFLVRLVLPLEPVRYLSLRIACILLLAGFLLGILAIRGATPLVNRFKSFSNLVSSEELIAAPKILSKQQDELIRKAVPISFVGDLILLRDQVYDAYEPKTGQYNFDPLFQYTKDPCQKVLHAHADLR